MRLTAAVGPYGCVFNGAQVEKRFAYIRKHYQRVTKKLTLDDDLASEGGAFAKCSGASNGSP